MIQEFNSNVTAGRASFATPWWRAACAIFVVLGITVVSWANAAPPEIKPKPPAKPVTDKLEIVEMNRENYRIVIPQRLMRSALNQLGDGRTFESALPTEEAQRQRTWIAGLAMSAALFSLVLVRRKSIWTKVFFALAFAVATYAGSQWVHADLGPRPLGPIPKLDEIEIVISRSARRVELQVPRDKVLRNLGGPAEEKDGKRNSAGFGSGSGAEIRPGAGK